MTRHSFAAGLVAGIVVTAAAVLALVAAGVVDTRNLRVEELDVVGAWDTRGSPDPSRWRPVNRRRFQVSDARNLVIHNGPIRLRWAGTPETPLALEIEPASSLGPLPRHAPGSFDPGPVEVTVVSNVEMRFALETPGVRQVVLVLAAYHGYATEIVPADGGRRSRLDLGVFRSPMVVANPSGVVVDRVEPGRGVVARPITAALGYVVAAPARRAPLFVLAAGRSGSLRSAATGPAAQAVSVEGPSPLRAFVGSLHGAAPPSGLFVPARGVRVPSLEWLAFTRTGERWRPVRQPGRISAEAAFVVPHGTDVGPSLSRLTTEGLSTLAAL